MDETPLPPPLHFLGPGNEAQDLVFWSGDGPTIYQPWLSRSRPPADKYLSNSTLAERKGTAATVEDALPPTKQTNFIF